MDEYLILAGLVALFIAITCLWGCLPSSGRINEVLRKCKAPLKKVNVKKYHLYFPYRDSYVNADYSDYDSNIYKLSVIVTLISYILCAIFEILILIACVLFLFRGYNPAKCIVFILAILVIYLVYFAVIFVSSYVINGYYYFKRKKNKEEDDMKTIRMLRK